MIVVIVETQGQRKVTLHAGWGKYSQTMGIYFIPPAPPRAWWQR
jgi:hypothetical protein